MARGLFPRPGRRCMRHPCIVCWLVFRTRLIQWDWWHFVCIHFDGAVGVGACGIHAPDIAPLTCRLQVRACSCACVLRFIPSSFMRRSISAMLLFPALFSVRARVVSLCPLSDHTALAYSRYPTFVLSCNVHRLRRCFCLRGRSGLGLHSGCTGCGSTCTRL